MAKHSKSVQYWHARGAHAHNIRNVQFRAAKKDVKESISRTKTDTKVLKNDMYLYNNLSSTSGDCSVSRTRGEDEDVDMFVGLIVGFVNALSL